MSVIEAKNIYLNYPIYGTGTRSLKRSLIDVATGGKLSKHKSRTIIIEALSDVSFSLQKGDRLGLIGHNGAGKSTLLKVLANIYEPQQGTLVTKGEIHTLLNLSVGLQEYATGYENIRINSFMSGHSEEMTEKTIEDIIEFTGLGNFLSMPVRTYSAGMRIRLAFALSTALEPDILLIDEVFGAGDAEFLEKAKHRMASLITTSNILVMSSHANYLIREFCNKVLWLEHGKVKAFGDTESILRDYEALTMPT